MFRTKTILVTIFIIILASSVSSQFLSRGVLRKTADCLVYDLLTPGNETLALVSHPVDSFHGYFPGDTVFIFGHLLIHVVAPCPGDAGTSLDVQFIGAPDANISVTGTLIWGVEAGCILIESPDGFSFLIDNRGDFQIGDTVNVSGSYDPYCTTICMQGIGCINNAIVTSGHTFSNDIRGLLVQGNNCIYFEDENENRIILSELGVYQPGNLVHVIGQPNYDPSICQESNYTFTVEAISQEGAICVGQRGNANGDIEGKVDVADLTFMIDYLFRGGNPPPVMDEANFNGSIGTIPVDITDVVAFVSYLFRSGPAAEQCQ